MNLLQRLTEVAGTESYQILIFGRFVLAVLLGMLIGIERELVNLRNGEHKIVGLRSMEFITLIGASAVLVNQFVPGTFVLGAAVIALMIMTTYVANFRANGNVGVTTSLVAFLAYFIGGMVMEGEVPIDVKPGPETEFVEVNLTLFALVVTILTTMILSLKQTFDRTLKRITPTEFFSTVKFAVIIFLVLPFLPDVTFAKLFPQENPYANAVLSSVNLYSLWFFVVLIAGIGYVGYVLSKILGPGRGVGVSGFLGGLTSSTAVMSTMSEQSKASKGLVNPLAFAAIIATSTSLAKQAIVAGVVFPALLPQLVWPFSCMVIASVAGALVLRYRQKHAESPEVPYKSPFALLPALKFVAFILGVKILMNLALLDAVKEKLSFLGDGLIYAIGIISGLADVDAITLGSSDAAKQSALTVPVAATVIALAGMSNLVVKGGMAKLFGSPEFGKRVLAVFGVTLLAGIAGVVAMRGLG